MAKWTCEQVIKKLTDSPGNIHCNDLQEMLGDLGFRVTKRASGKHRTYTHPELADFLGGSFDGGHGSNAVIKKCYVRDVLSVLRQFETELTSIQKAAKK